MNRVGQFTQPFIYRGQALRPQVQYTKHRHYGFHEIPFSTHTIKAEKTSTNWSWVFLGGAFALFTLNFLDEKKKEKSTAEHVTNVKKILASQWSSFDSISERTTAYLWKLDHNQRATVLAMLIKDPLYALCLAQIMGSGHSDALLWALGDALQQVSGQHLALFLSELLATVVGLSQNPHLIPKKGPKSYVIQDLLSQLTLSPLNCEQLAHQLMNNGVLDKLLTKEFEDYIDSRFLSTVAKLPKSTPYFQRLFLNYLSNPETTPKRLAFLLEKAFSFKPSEERLKHLLPTEILWRNLPALYAVCLATDVFEMCDLLKYNTEYKPTPMTTDLYINTFREVSTKVEDPFLGRKLLWICALLENDPERFKETMARFSEQELSLIVQACRTSSQVGLADRAIRFLVDAQIEPSRRSFAAERKIGAILKDFTPTQLHKVVQGMLSLDLWDGFVVGDQEKNKQLLTTLRSALHKPEQLEVLFLEKLKS